MKKHPKCLTKILDKEDYDLFKDYFKNNPEDPDVIKFKTDLVLCYKFAKAKLDLFKSKQKLTKRDLKEIENLKELKENLLLDFKLFLTDEEIDALK